MTPKPSSLLPAALALDPYWAMEPDALQAGIRFLEAVDAETVLKIQASQAEQAAQSASNGSGDGSDGEQESPYPVVNGTAVLTLSGPMTKKPTCMQMFFGGTSTIQVRRNLQQAALDPKVRNILLYVDSPGGQVSGTGDLAGDVFSARQQKPVYAYLEDLAASAAYWVASQATYIAANPTALVGSIGTYQVIEDYSRRAENAGIKVHVVKAGTMKGAGVTGTPVTDAQIKDAQRVVNALNQQFVSGVQRARGFSDEQMSKLADGRVHIAGEAQKRGLIDAVVPLDEFLGHIATGTLPRKPAATTMTPTHATHDTHHTDRIEGTNPMPKTLREQLQEILSQTETEASDAPAVTAVTAPATAQAPPSVDASAIESLKAHMEAQLAAQTASLNALLKQNDELREQIKAEKAASALKLNEARIEEAVKSGKLAPSRREAFVKLAQENASAFELAISAVEDSPSLFTSRMTLISAKELVEQGTDAEKRLDAIAREKMADEQKIGRTMTYEAAFDLACLQNRDLAAEYRREAEAAASSNAKRAQ